MTILILLLVLLLFIVTATQNVIYASVSQPFFCLVVILVSKSLKPKYKYKFDVRENIFYLQKQNVAENVNPT